MVIYIFILLQDLKYGVYFNFINKLLELQSITTRLTLINMIIIEDIMIHDHHNHIIDSSDDEVKM